MPRKEKAPKTPSISAALADPEMGVPDVPSGQEPGARYEPVCCSKSSFFSSSPHWTLWYLSGPHGYAHTINVHVYTRSTCSKHSTNVVFTFRIWNILWCFLYLFEIGFFGAPVLHGCINAIVQQFRRHHLLEYVHAMRVSENMRLHLSSCAHWC